jgi:hypothetical protein
LLIALQSSPLLGSLLIWKEKKAELIADNENADIFLLMKHIHCLLSHHSTIPLFAAENASNVLKHVINPPYMNKEYCFFDI